ncbi:aminotransferase class V-fold PLP-dependent enzyme [Mycolicibacterium sp. 018/SC-01/001]|uniref:aminotransferase class V-fold PLP-dependent enzyme n=1 Tax=Mycolicibacterium sp. 018/SC-01/001 TaxID=2592069 RepID=UPI00117BFED1|nr:aminotransferase class V-fold PLP-dependent enzyme [Mycolicibacterium sp. 018/SC-01/001]TRW87957.1 aminotransferase class V-fold PLP-dependent enzyme [Mycolicibacterium sp. 018/SC-01/001]
MLTDSEVAALRSETPGVANSAYLMNAGAALMPVQVVDAVVSHLRLEAAIGGYAAADEVSDRLDAVYDSVASLIGAHREEVALTENATVAWQLAFYSLDFRVGDRILTGEAEYAANYVAYLQVARRTGAVVEVVPSDESGQLDVGALGSMIDERVRLISVTWMPTNGGLVNPAEEIGRLARRHGIFYLLDACQAAGQWVIDVGRLGCDALTGTGRKFLRGPRGTGFLYVRRSTLEQMHPPMIDHFSAPWTSLHAYTLRDDARRFETWENAYALRLGLGAAVDLAASIGVHRIHQRCGELAGRLRAGLTSLDRVTVHDLGAQQSAIVSFSVDGVDAADLVNVARNAGIVIGASAPSSTRIDATRRKLPVLNRASPHYFNTVSEIDRLVDVVRTASR